MRTYKFEEGCGGMMAIRLSIVGAITDFLATAPTSEQIVNYRAPDHFDARLHELLDRKANNTITAAERTKLDEFLRMDHFMIVLKAKVQLRLRNQR
jgi:hypothetical protein